MLWFSLPLSSSNLFNFSLRLVFSSSLCWHPVAGWRRGSGCWDALVCVDTVMSEQGERQRSNNVDLGDSGVHGPLKSRIEWVKSQDPEQG